MSNQFTDIRLIWLRKEKKEEMKMMRMKPDAGHSNTKNDCKERGGPTGPPKQRSKNASLIINFF